MARVRRCAFCPSEAKMSAEHLWSAWIGELLNFPSYEWRRVDPQSHEQQFGRSGGMNFTAKVVCKPCNNTWMSTIEGRTKDVFSSVIKDGTQTMLSLSDIVTLATFAFKCSVVASHMNSTHEPFFTRGDRERFRTSLAIPGPVQMWTARYSGKHSGYGLLDSHVIGPNIPKANPWFGLEFYVFTYIAGRLAFQVHAPRWELVQQRGNPVPIMQPGQIWESTAVQFWPNGSGLPIQWPPPQDLSDDAINKFVHRWSGRIRLG